MSAFMFVEVCGYLCAPISILSNVLLIFVIRNTTSRHLAPHRISFGLLALSDILLSVSFLLSQPCVLLDGDVIVVVLLGPAVFIHSVFISICFVIFLATLILCLLQVTAPYVFKAISRQNHTLRWQIVTVIATLLVTWLLFIVPLISISLTTHGDSIDRLEHFDRFVKDYTKFTWTSHYVIYRLSTLGKLWLVLVLLVSVTGCVAVAVNSSLSSGMIGCGSWNGNPTARFSQIANTARLNASSAFLLIVAPLLLFTIVAVSGRETFSYSIPLFLGAAFLPILNAHFVVLNIRTYRRSLSSLFSFRRKFVGPISHISSDH
ncbi:hypothetical protein Q1695_007836 [Nippostrongylus brasiliensis]|nr:hypothetical protein Q1695_007836 [Nippostrongylus brasiliensis]